MALIENATTKWDMKQASLQITPSYNHCFLLKPSPNNLFPSLHAALHSQSDFHSTPPFLFQKKLFFLEAFSNIFPPLDVIFPQLNPFFPNNFFQTTLLLQTLFSSSNNPFINPPPTPDNPLPKQLPPQTTPPNNPPSPKKSTHHYATQVMCTASPLCARKSSTAEALFGLKGVTTRQKVTTLIEAREFNFNNL